MKIVLINPPITSAERYGINIGSIGGHQAPLGLCCLAAFLEKNGVEVSLLDAEMEQLSNEHIIQRISVFAPDAVGFTSTTVAFHRAKDLAETIKLFQPNIPIIIGGCHVTANPKETLSYSCFDYGVCHEGEISLLELLRALQNGGSVENINGIIYRKGKGTFLTERQTYITDLDILPFPARHLLRDAKKYLPPLGCYLKRPVINMVTSRGCPYECIFCDTNVFGRRIRYHSARYVVAEIEHVIETYKAKEVSFVDDTFTVDPVRLQEILSLLKKKNIHISWSCMTQVNTLTKDLLRKMKEMGCWQVSIGIESGDQGILNVIKKRISLEQVKKVVNWSHELDILVKGFFMLGNLTETAETIEKTINFAKSIPLTDVVVTLATPIRGTEFYALAPRYGTMQSTRWSDFSYWRAVFIPYNLDKYFLFIKQKEFYRKFYCRWQVLLRQNKKIKTFGRIIKIILNIGRIILLSAYQHYKIRIAAKRTNLTK